MDEGLNDTLPEAIGAALQKLDREAAKRAAAVDPARTAARVLERLKQEPEVEHPARRWNIPALRIAASVAVLLIGAAVAQRVAFPPHPAVTDTTMMTHLQVEEAMILRAVDELAEPLSGAMPASTVTIDDLNEQELQSLLDSMESPGGAM